MSRRKTPLDKKIDAGVAAIRAKARREKENAKKLDEMFFNHFEDMSVGDSIHIHLKDNDRWVVISLDGDQTHVGEGYTPVDALMNDGLVTSKTERD